MRSSSAACIMEPSLPGVHDGPELTSTDPPNSWVRTKKVTQPSRSGSFLSRAPSQDTMSTYRSFNDSKTHWNYSKPNQPQSPATNTSCIQGSRLNQTSVNLQSDSPNSSETTPKNPTTAPEQFYPPLTRSQTDISSWQRVKPHKSHQRFPSIGNTTDFQRFDSPESPSTPSLTPRSQPLENSQAQFQAQMQAFPSNSVPTVMEFKPRKQKHKSKKDKQRKDDLSIPSHAKKPSWIADSAQNNCKMCKATFKFNIRRHHCRNCGELFCQDCSSMKIRLPFLGYKKKKRVCDQCYNAISEAQKQETLRYSRNFLKSHRTLQNSFKVIIFGAPGAGKTTFVHKLVTGRVPPEEELSSMFCVMTLPYDSTVQFTNNRHIQIPFHIWDINSNPRFFALLDIYCKDIDACILTYDITKTNALENLKKPWIETIRKFDRTNTIVMLLGLKSDDVENRKISTEEGWLFAKTQAMDGHVEASSFSDTNMQTVMDSIGSKIVDRHLRTSVLRLANPVLFGASPDALEHAVPD